MFKRGGSSYEAQGTGITSPYDTPRRGYAHGVTQEEINERRANLYQDPRSDWSYAAQGFSALANPYTKKGEAKTIGEMLYEGAHDVRGSKAEGRGLEQAAELANIQSDEDILRSEEKFERDKVLKGMDVKATELKKLPWGRRVMNRDKLILSNNTPDLDSYEFTNQHHMSMAIGEETILDLQNASPDKIIRALVLPSTAYTYNKDTGEWTYSVNNLVQGMVYFEPTEKRWFVVDSTGEKPTPIFKGSYEEADSALTALGDNIPGSSNKKIKKTNKDDEIEIKTNEIKMKITANLKDVELTDAVVMDEAAKAGIKLVSSKDFPTKGKAWKHYLAENEMTLEQFKRILYEKKMSDSYASMTHDRGVGKVIDEVTEEIKVAETMSTGGRAGYALGSPEPQGEEVEPDTDDLNELTSWWKSEVENSFNS